MFWTLLLAHFIGDYPLQTDAMVVAKQRLPGLVLHIAVHLVVMYVLLFGIVGLDVAALWMLPIAIAATHMLIDWGKTRAGKRWPDIIVIPYVADQMAHYAILLLAAWWLDRTHGIDMFRPSGPWIVPSVTVLVATYVTYITEKVCSLTQPERLARVNAQGWHRMVSRATLMCGLWLGFTSSILWGGLTVACGLCFHWFDLAGRRLPEVTMDTVIAIVAYGFLALFL